MSNRRQQIMDNCPDEFHDKLKEFIDELEMKVNEMAHDLEQVSIDSLDNIHTVAGELRTLGKELY